MKPQGNRIATSIHYKATLTSASVYPMRTVESDQYLILSFSDWVIKFYSNDADIDIEAAQMETFNFLPHGDMP